MRHILLILFFFKSVSASDESDEKYIDLLPEDEKREFLEKIARRILEDYQNSNVPKESHINISDDALNSHTAYVQALLEEERNKQIERKDNQEVTQKNEVYDRRSNENENQFLDLTLRTNKRDKRRNVQNYSNVNEYNIIPVLPLYDELDGNKKAEKQIDNTQPLLAEKEKVVERENNKNDLAKTETIRDTNNSSDLIDLKQSFIYDDSDDNSHNITTVIDSSDKNLTNNNQNVSLEFTTETLTTEAILNATTTIKSRKLNNGNEITVENENNNETIELTSKENLTHKKKFNFQVQQTTIKLTTTKSDNETTTISSISTVTSKESSSLDNLETNPDLMKNTSVSVGNDSVVGIVSNTFLNHTNGSTILIISNTSEKAIKIEEPNNMTTNKYLENEKPNLRNESYKKVQISTKGISVEILNKNMQTARKKYAQKQLDKSDQNFIQDIQTKENFKLVPNENKSTYYIYEVSAERPQFIAKNDGEEHVYYAPVYNYSPEFAYFNSYNRYGPNENDKISESKTTLNDFRLFIKDIDRRTKFKNPNSAFINPYKLNGYNILKHKNQYNILESPYVMPNSDNYNPNDYIDMDYFFGRNEDQSYMRKGKEFDEDQSKYFPDTNEINHPYLSIPKRNVQDHVRAVRKILYANQRFGYIPPKKIDSKAHKLRSREFQIHNIFQVDDNTDKDDIAIDYYFGRQSSQELSLSKHKFTYKYPEPQNFNPITPNPMAHTTKEKADRESVGLEATVNVLNDFIKMDNEDLVRYDWLGTAVNIQSAIGKLKDLTSKLQNGQYLHPSDFELLKYVIYLYKSSQVTTNDITVNMKLLQNTLNELRKTVKSKSLLPKIVKKKKGFMSAVKKWKNVATFLRTLIRNKKETVDQFQMFLNEIKFHLDDLHDAIKHVAMVTKYKNQRWHDDLKDLYLRNADKRKLLQVILHLSLSRLFSLIEESSINGLEDNFSNYVKNHEEEVETARSELKYVLRLLDEFARIN